MESWLCIKNPYTLLWSQDKREGETNLSLYRGAGAVLTERIGTFTFCKVSLGVDQKLSMNCGLDIRCYVIHEYGWRHRIFKMLEKNYRD